MVAGAIAAGYGSMIPSGRQEAAVANLAVLGLVAVVDQETVLGVGLVMVATRASPSAMRGTVQRPVAVEVEDTRRQTLTAKDTSAEMDRKSVAETAQDLVATCWECAAARTEGRAVRVSREQRTGGRDGRDAATLDGETCSCS